MATKIDILEQAYGSFLKALKVEPRADGALCQVGDGGLERLIMVDDKVLVIPNSENTRNHNENVVMFHPLSENLLLGESPVLKETRALVVDALHDKILSLVEALLKIGVDNDLVSTLTPTQIRMLSCTSGVDETTIKNWKSITRRVESRGSSNRVLTLFLKRGAEHNGENYKRLAVLNFNLLDEINNNENSIYGVKVRKADRVIYKNVLELLIDPETDYSCGSNSSVAPYFDALVKAFTKVFKELNGVAWSFRKPIKEVTGNDLHVKDEFSEVLEDLSILKDILPSLPYNEGDRGTSKENREKLNIQAQQQAPVPPPVAEPVAVDTYSCANLQTQPVSVAPVQPGSPPPPLPQAPARLPSIEEQLYGYSNQAYPMNPGYPMGNGWYNPQQQYMGTPMNYGYQPPVAPVPPKPQGSTGSYGAWNNPALDNPMFRPW